MRKHITRTWVCIICTFIFILMDVQNKILIECNVHLSIKNCSHPFKFMIICKLNLVEYFLVSSKLTYLDCIQHELVNMGIISMYRYVDILFYDFQDGLAHVSSDSTRCHLFSVISTMSATMPAEMTNLIGCLPQHQFP